MDGWMEAEMTGWMDGWMDGWMAYPITNSPYLNFQGFPAWLSLTRLHPPGHFATSSWKPDDIDLLEHYLNLWGHRQAWLSHSS